MGERAPGGRFRSTLAVVVGVGAIVRITRLLVSKWNEPLLLNDSLYYSIQASQLAHGTWFHEPFSNQPGAEHGPLTSLLMATVSWGNDPVNRQRLITVACGVATVAMIGLVARRLAGPHTGIVAALIAAVYPNLWASDGLVMSESVSCLLVAATLLTAVRWIEAPSVGRAAAIGAVVGLATLARSELVLFAPLVAVVLLLIGRRRKLRVGRQVLVALAVTAAVIGPWVGFNATRFDKPVLLTTNDGPLLLGTNCGEAYYGPALGGWSLYCVVNAHVGENGVDASVRSAQQRRQGLSYARHHIGRWPVVVAARLARSFDVYEVGNLVHNDVGEERERAVSWAGVITFWCLLPLAVAGGRRLPRAHLAVTLMPVMVVLFTTVVFYGGHRMRSSAEPVIAVLAAVSVAGVARVRRSIPL
ncbi:MAG TPA: glycosyltransferase family 39 protein [Ilumatobacteraceae bacterium]